MEELASVYTRVVSNVHRLGISENEHTVIRGPAANLVLNAVLLVWLRR